jgi:hypothetical protein
MCIQDFGRKPKGKMHLEGLGVEVRMILDNIKIDLKEVGGEVWTGLIWLKIGTGGGML